MLQRTLRLLPCFHRSRYTSTYNMQSRNGNKLFNASADRNKQPILEILQQILNGEESKEKLVLEISSGSGQHVAHFAERFKHWLWQPSDYDEQYLGSIKAYIEEQNLTNIKEPILVDVTTDSNTWGGGTLFNAVDLMININMIHITPIECTKGLFAGAGNLLKPGGRLVTYGPYALDGKLVPESNVAFDARLRDENPAWGVRDVSMLTDLGNQHGMMLESMFDMPANNKCLCFVKI